MALLPRFERVNARNIILAERRGSRKARGRWASGSPSRGNSARCPQNVFARSSLNAAVCAVAYFLALVFFAASSCDRFLLPLT